MVKVIRQGVYYMDGRLVKESQAFMTSDKKERACKNTALSGVLSAHRAGDGLSADVFAAEEETYADVVRAADKLGVKEFPQTTVLFADPNGDFDFSLSAAEKFGAELVPSQLGASEAYLRECVVAGGQLVLGCGVYACGALGALSICCDGGEFLDAVTGPHPLHMAGVVAVCFRGKPKKGVGPTDIALAIEQALVRAGDFGQDKILECFGADNLSMDFRIGIDTRLSELCYATLWATDDTVKSYFAAHGREKDFKQIAPKEPAYYDGGVTVDLGKIEPMIALGSKIYTVRELNEAPEELLADAEAAYEKEHGFARDFAYACRDEKVLISCAYIDKYLSSYETLAEMAEILRGTHLAAGTACTVNPSSAAVYRALAESGSFTALLEAGVLPETAVCAGTGGLYVSDAAEGDVILDARTIARTLACGGILTPATDAEYSKRWKKYTFEGAVYGGLVYHGAGKPQKREIDYVDRVPMPDFDKLPDALLLAIVDTEHPITNPAYPESESIETAYAALLPCELEWTEALALRECGVRAVLSAEFSADTRKNLSAWGILPLTAKMSGLKAGQFLRIEGVAEAVAEEERLVGTVLSKGKPRDIVLGLGDCTAEERELLRIGGCMNRKINRR